MKFHQNQFCSILVLTVSAYLVLDVPGSVCILEGVESLHEIPIRGRHTSDHHSAATNNMWTPSEFTLILKKLYTLSILWSLQNLWVHDSFCSICQRKSKCHQQRFYFLHYDCTGFVIFLLIRSLVIVTYNKNLMCHGTVSVFLFSALALL